MDDKQHLYLARLREKPLSVWEKEDFVDLVCARCEFYKPKKEKLECAAFKILVELLKSEVISIDQVEKSQCKE